MIFVKVTLMYDGKPQGSFINKPNELDISGLFDGADGGEKYELEAVEMTEKEYSELSEFTGF